MAHNIELSDAEISLLISGLEKEQQYKEDVTQGGMDFLIKEGFRAEDCRALITKLRRWTRGSSKSTSRHP